MKKPGTAPGTVDHTGQRHMQDIRITVHDYSENHIDEFTIDDIEQIRPYLESSSKTWIKVYGLHDLTKLKSIWGYFNLHPLIQEDIVNTSQRPKIERYDNCIFFVLRMLTYADEKQYIESEQISLVLGPNYVLSFQETDRDYFAPILTRLAGEGSRIRRLNTDYLTYALVDTVVDYYFHTLDKITDHIEAAEDQLLEDPDKQILHRIHKLRREVIFIRKSISPLRDAINSAIRDESNLIDDYTKVYLRDVYDHVIHVIDNVENYRDMILSLHDMYMSQVSNKMNEVMKVLTIIATIFIPLTFIAGIYGMNFNAEVSPYNMPEVNWYWGYPAVLTLMGIMALAMIYYFKQKEWL